MTAPRILALLLATLTLLVSGCAEDDPKPKIADPEPTQMAAPTEVAEPDAEETPEEFIHRWADLEEEMLNTGETEQYEAITGPCQSCGSLVSRVRDYYEAGGYITWGGLELRRIRPIGNDDFEVWVSVKPTEYKPSAEAAVERLEGGRSLYRLKVEESRTGLILTDFTELER